MEEENALCTVQRLYVCALYSFFFLLFLILIRILFSTSSVLRHPATSINIVCVHCTLVSGSGCAVCLWHWHSGSSFSAVRGNLLLVVISSTSVRFKFVRYSDCKARVYLVLLFLCVRSNGVLLPYFW